MMKFARLILEEMNTFYATAVALGAMLLLFFGSIIVTLHWHGDLSLTQGRFDRGTLSDITLILHASVGLFLLLSPLQRRFFGAAATLVALASVALTWYFRYTADAPLKSVIGLLILVLLNLLILAPSLLVLFSSFRTHSGESLLQAPEWNADDAESR
jgi:hypothetical protein